MPAPSREEGSPAALPWPGPATWAAVAAGGALGTEARYALLLLFPPTLSSFDWATLGINTAASLALGWLTGRWLSRPLPAWARAGLGPGLLGGFSTFSALALSLDRILAGGRPLEAAAYLAASLVLGLGAAAAGLFLGARRRPGR